MSAQGSSTERTASRFGAVLIVCGIAPARRHPASTLPSGADLVRLSGDHVHDNADADRLVDESCNLLVAAYNLVENPGPLEPVQLFYTSVGVWSGNVLIFTLIVRAPRDSGCRQGDTG
jgi:hypothetical protein